MSSVANLLALHEAQYGPRQGAQSTGGSAFAPILDVLKEKADEKRRQENVKKQMSTFQQMMQTMNSMPDNSTAARGVGLLDDEKNKDRKGITGISTMIPQKEMSIDENGALNIKIGMRATTPQEQKAQFEIQKAQMDLAKQNLVTESLGAYQNGIITHQQFFNDLNKNGVPIDDNIQAMFDRASLIREDNLSRKRLMAAQSGQAQQTVQPQPQEQPFMFDKSKSLQEQKLAGEIQDRAETKLNKSQAVVDSANTTIESIDELLKNVRYFGPVGGRTPAWVSPADPGKLRWERNYNFLEAKNIVNLIDQMKSQSRTGATGFGQLNREELKVLKDASMVLDKGMNEANASEYLLKMKTALEKIKDREQNGYDFERSGQAQPQPQPTAQPTITREQAIAELKRRGKL